MSLANAFLISVGIQVGEPSQAQDAQPPEVLEFSTFPCELRQLERWSFKTAVSQGAAPSQEPPLDTPRQPRLPARLARSNRITRIAHAAVEKALATASVVAPERRAIVGASVLASLRANVRYESRRLATGIAAPRDFALTAANAWLGELTAAHEVLGPSLCLVSPEAAIHAVTTAIAWLATDLCEQAIVVAAESVPQDTTWVENPPGQRQTPTRHPWFDGAVAVVLERQLGGTRKTNMSAAIAGLWLDTATASEQGHECPASHAAWPLIEALKSVRGGSRYAMRPCDGTTTVVFDRLHGRPHGSERQGV